MSLNNIILMCLIFLLVIYNLIIMIVYIKRETILHKRGKINYSNYHSMKSLFDLSISTKAIVFALVGILLTITMCCIILFNDALKVYLWLLVATLGLNIMGLASYLTSTQYNRNLKEFDEYHNKIESSYANKDKIINNLKVIENKYQFVNGEIQKLNKKISELVLGFIELPNIQECYDPLNKVKKEQEDILMSFDDKMPGVFTDSLIKYLKSGGMANAQTYIFNPNMDLNIDPIVTAISNKLKSKYLTYIQESFINLKHKDSASLIELVNILSSFDLFDEKYIDILIDVVNGNPTNNKPVIKYLFDNKHVNYKLINKCVTANREWIFDYPVAKYVSNNELTTLVADIINRNNMNITNKFLMLVDKGSSDAIKHGINVASLNNESSVVMSRYIELLELDGGFNSLANRYENLALSLNNYNLVTGTSNSKVTSIINNDTFYENKDYLDETYNSVLVKLEPVLMKTFRSMLYFSLYCSNDFKYFSQEKMNAIYVEYKRQLNVIGLLCLSSVLDAIILANSKDTSTSMLVKKNIDDLTGNTLYEKFYPVTGNKANNLRLYGKDIIQNLFKNNKQELSTLVNHIENERLVLDKIRYM